MEGPRGESPRSGADAGDLPASPALFAASLLAEGTVGAARDAARAWYADLVGPLLVPAPATAGIQEQLAPGDHGLRVTLVAQPAPDDPAGLAGLREARDRLLDDDRLELTGVHVPLPAPGSMEALLAGLDFSVPAWLEVPASPGWEDALEVLAADGAEFLAVRLPPDALAAGATTVGPGPGQATAVAALLRRAVDLGVPMRVTGAGGGATTTPQLLAVLGAVRVALDGGGVPDVAAVLAERRPAPLAAGVRRIGDADAAALRTHLDGVVVPDAQQTTDDLAALGLVDPRA